jgi:hypothetical protein
MRTIWDERNPLVMYFVAETAIERIWVAMFQNRDRAIKIVSKDLPKEIRQEVIHDESRLGDRAEAVAMKLMDEESCQHGNGTSGECARCLAVVGFELRTVDNSTDRVRNATDVEDDIAF